MHKLLMCGVIVLCIALLGWASPVKAEQPVPSVAFVDGALFNSCSPVFDDPLIEPIVVLPLYVRSDESPHGVRAELEVPGYGIVSSAQFMELGLFDGPAVFIFWPTPYTVPQGTPLTARLWTYSDTKYSVVAWYSEVTFECFSTDVISLYSGGSAATGIGVPNLGRVQITQAQAQPAYDAPDGHVVRDGAGNELWLPHDADGNSFDTFVVTAIKEVGDRWWVALFMGGASPVWVPLDQVTPLTAFDLD